MIKREGQRDVACFHVDMEMVERMQELLALRETSFKQDSGGNLDTDKRLYYGLNACKAALIK